VGSLSGFSARLGRNLFGKFDPFLHGFFRYYGYGYIHAEPVLYIVAAVFIGVALLLEPAITIKTSTFKKSIQIERTLNDLLVNEEEPYIHKRGISTLVKTPTWRGYFKQLRWRNVLFWGPYFCVLSARITLAWLQPVTAESKKPCEEHPRVAVLD